MKKIIFLLAACLTLAVSTFADTANARNTMTVELQTASDTLAAYAQQSEQLEKAEAKIARLEKNLKEWEQKDNWFHGPVAIMGTILIFVFPFAVVFCWFYFRSKNRRAKYQLINNMMASGQQNAMELYNSVINEDGRQSRNLLQHGIRMTFVGIGLFFFFAICLSKQMSSIGILVACIGVGESIAGYLQKREEKRLRQAKDERKNIPTENETSNPTPNEQ